MEENALPQEPQTPEPETLPASETLPVPETTTTPAPSPTQENQNRGVFDLIIYMAAYMLGGAALGGMFGLSCWLVLTTISERFKSVYELMFAVPPCIGIVTLAGLGIVTSVILGKRMAAVNGAFKRWFYYAFIGAGIGAVVGVLLMWGTLLVGTDLFYDELAAVLFVSMAGFSGGIFGSILFATVGSLLYCADDPNTKKTARNSTVRGIAACMLGPIAMIVIFVLSILPLKEMPPEMVLYIILLVFAAVATGSMLGVVIPKTYAKIGAGIGFLLGAIALGWVFGLILENPLYGAVFGAALGSLIGVLSGALVGAVFDGTVDGEAVFAVGCAGSVGWVAFWFAALTVPFVESGLLLIMAIAAMVFGIIGKTFGARMTWGTGGKTGTLLGGVLGMILSIALAVWLVTQWEELILFIMFVGVQGLTFGMTLGAFIGAAMDKRRQRSSVSELPTDSTL